MMTSTMARKRTLWRVEISLVPLALQLLAGSGFVSFVLRQGPRPAIHV